MKIDQIKYNQKLATLTVEPEGSEEVETIQLNNELGRSVLAELVNAIPHGVDIEWAEIELERTEGNLRITGYSRSQCFFELAEEIISWRYNPKTDIKELQGMVMLDDQSWLTREYCEGDEWWEHHKKPGKPFWVQ